jgi:membrane peptidoglycan carboxypeptidase
MRKTDLTISTRLGAFLGLVGMSTIAGVLVAAMVTPAIAVSGIAANSTIGVFEDIPDNLQIDNLAQKTVLFAKKGDQQVPFAEFFSQDREEVPWEAVSQYAKDAAIATEDPRYYEHGGVDVLSAARALAQNVLNDEVQSGASTITMQYVRNVLVQKAQNMVDSSDKETQAAGRKAFTEATQPDMPRKLKEMRMAIGVEKKYSKNEILLAYLNIANFGSRVYGIESAARYYFNVSAADLNLEQAASLIATVNAPEIYKIDNKDNLERNKARRDLLLANMLKEQKITQEQHDAAAAAPITPTITPSTSGCIQADPISAAYFCDYVKNEILTNKEFGDTAADRDAVLKRGGMQVYTTLDLDIQANAADQMRKQVPATARFTKIGGSVVSREVKTGRIIAMAQNTDYGVAQDQPGVTEINYAADKAHGGSAGFQVGSTYKIFTLVDWLKSGKSIYQTVNASKSSPDAATTSPDPRTTRSPTTRTPAPPPTRTCWRRRSRPSTRRSSRWRASSTCATSARRRPTWARTTPTSASCRASRPTWSARAATRSRPSRWRPPSPPSPTRATCARPSRSTRSSSRTTPSS